MVYKMSKRIQDTTHQDIIFTSRTRKIKPMEEMDNEHQEISEEPDLTNPEDLFTQIYSIIYIFFQQK